MASLAQHAAVEAAIARARHRGWRHRQRPPFQQRRPILVLRRRQPGRRRPHSRRGHRAVHNARLATCGFPRGCASTRCPLRTSGRRRVVSVASTILSMAAGGRMGDVVDADAVQLGYPLGIEEVSRWVDRGIGHRHIASGSVVGTRVEAATQLLGRFRPREASGPAVTMTPRLVRASPGGVGAGRGVHRGRKPTGRGGPPRTEGSLRGVRPSAERRCVGRVRGR
ncbi:hypothetical protein SAMN04489731_1384 [Amycolatopsis regifaucium]|nr:hypothetical protein SAMN04489731_1384 [Amycolatopsis regifaucium]